MRILVCGDRNWSDYPGLVTTMAGLVAEFGAEITIVHGNARGADQMAGEEAIGLGLNVWIFPARWGRHGRAAGVLRNQQMLDMAKPDLVVAFHDRLGESRGTKDMWTRAMKAGIECRLVSHAQ